MRGYLYILSNPAFPDLLKIGRTMEPPDARLRQLNTTGVPSTFVLEVTFLVSEVEEVEKKAHELLSEFRHNSNREFFRTNVSEVLETILPIILPSLRSTINSEIATKKPGHLLSHNEVSVLQTLVSIASSFGIGVYLLKDYCGGDILSLEICLANLYAKKLVSRRAVTNDSTGPRWVATPRGTKLLADHGLVDDWMRKNSGA